MIQQGFGKAISTAVETTYTAQSVQSILSTVFVKFSAAPTSSGDLTVNLVHGGVDFEVHREDPSVEGLTNLQFSPDVAISLRKGDSIRVNYPNADSLQVDVLIRVFDSF